MFYVSDDVLTVLWNNFPEFGWIIYIPSQDWKYKFLFENIAEWLFATIELRRMISPISWSHVGVNQRFSWLPQAWRDLSTILETLDFREINFNLIRIGAITVRPVPSKFLSVCSLWRKYNRILFLEANCFVHFQISFFKKLIIFS